MSPAPASSRMVKREQQKAVKQTLLWGGISAVILLLFLFLVIPYAPKLLATIVDGGAAVTQDDEIPPQTPVFNSPPQATNITQIELSGYAEPASTVVFINNGNQIAEVTAEEDGTFTQGVQLQEGDNILTAYAKDEADNESVVSREYFVVLDTETPTLTLAEDFVDGMEIVGKDKKLLQITGTTESGAKVAINDRFLFARPDGSFSYQFSLSEGDNTLKFVVSDKAGNQLEQEMTIKFRP